MNDLDRRALLGVAGLAGVAAVAASSKAGPLSPPPGPVVSTPGPEPRTAINATNTPGDANSFYLINQPGSYYLTGNITGFFGQHCIKVTASDVTIDLCGFRLQGVAGSLDGINAPTAGQRNVSVRNGTIAEFGNGGINANSATGCRFADLRLISNALGGLATGTDAMVDRVLAKGGTVGISVGDRSRVSDCNVASVVANGTGILAGQNCVVTACAAVSCSGTCIDVANGSVVSNCNGSGSATSHGIRLNYGAMATGCVANSNFLNGIEALQRNKVFDCQAVANTQNGIHPSFTGLVQGCFCESNGVCGILVDSGGGVTIRGNSCLENGNGTGANGAGIRLTNGGSICVVEQNVVAANYRGIDATTVRNFIAGNRAYGNTNADYVVVANNTYGPIVAAAGVGDITATVNANHPQANFRH